MRRTIQIGDKYKSLLDSYESELDKEEFNMLIIKLLKVNKEFEDKNMDIFLICELINKYNLDFYTLINLFSKFSQENEIIVPTPVKKEVIVNTKPQNYENSPILNLNNTKNKPLEKKETTKIEEVQEKNIPKVEEKKEVIIEKEKPNNNDSIFNNVDNDLEDDFDILGLGIRLT